VTIHLNGAPRDTAAPTVAALLDELCLPRQSILVERNTEPLHRDAWPATPLRENDRLEILRVAAGG
jgi:thiamine biosynthesis protein ThiS